MQAGVSSDQFEEESVDLEAGELAPMKRVSSELSSRLETYALLRRDSMRTEGSGVRRDERICQKIYVANEDLTIVVAGYRTATIGFILCTCLYAFTFGLGYILLRWFPRWRIRLFGLPTPLHDSTWVVIEVRVSYCERKIHVIMSIESMGRNIGA